MILGTSAGNWATHLHTRQGRAVAGDKPVLAYFIFHIFFSVHVMKTPAARTTRGLLVCAISLRAALPFVLQLQ